MAFATNRPPMPIQRTEIEESEGRTVRRVCPRGHTARGYKHSQRRANDRWSARMRLSRYDLFGPGEDNLWD